MRKKSTHTLAGHSTATAISGHAWQAGDASQPTTHCLGADTQQRWTSWSPHDPGKAEGTFLLARVPADVEKWIRKCEPCHRRNRPPQKPQAPLGTITAEYPFQKLSWHIMGPLLTSSKGHCYILVVTRISSPNGWKHFLYDLQNPLCWPQSWWTR